MLRQQYNPRTWVQQISKDMLLSRINNRVGKHLLFTSSTITASDAMWPTRKLLKTDRYMLRKVWQTLNCLSIHATYFVIIAGASPGEGVECRWGRQKRDSLRIAGGIQCIGQHIYRVTLIGVFLGDFRINLHQTCTQYSNEGPQHWNAAQFTKISF